MVSEREQGEYLRNKEAMDKCGFPKGKERIENFFRKNKNAIEKKLKYALVNLPLAAQQIVSDVINEG